MEGQERGVVPKIYAEMFWRRWKHQVGEGCQERRGVEGRVVVDLALTKAAICAASSLESVRQSVGKNKWNATGAITRGIRMWDYTLGFRQGQRAPSPRVNKL